MKKATKILSILLAAVLLFAFTSATFAVENAEKELVLPRFGNFNKDDKVNLQDVSLMLKYLAEWELDEDSYELISGDWNANGNVNMADVGGLLRWLADYPPAPWYYPPEEEYAYWDYRAELRDQGLPYLTLDEWLAEQGIDPVVYHHWDNWVRGTHREFFPSVTDFTDWLEEKWG